MLKDYVYTNSPYTEDRLERSSQDVMFLIPQAEIQHTINNVNVSCDACLNVAGINFKHLFLNIVGINLT
jgi:hypothetical protein